MRILFIMPLALPAYLFQLAALSAFLKSKGHSVRYEELIIDGDIKACHLEKIKKSLVEFSPDLIGFSAYEMSFNWIAQISDYIKTIFPDAPIIVGGYYPTLSAEEVLSYPAVDIICRGEGEYALIELLNSLENKVIRKDIQNLWFKDEGRIIRNSLRPLIDNLDTLPFVDRQLFTSENRKGGALEIMASRGCSFDCTNCSNHAFKGIYAGKGQYVRYRSVGHVLSEIELCLSKEDFRQIQFEDDMFTLNRKWLLEFCQAYKKNIKKPFFCNIRPESGTPEILSLLKEAGCVHVSIGVESGDEGIRRKVLSRNMPNKVIISAFKNAKNLGLKRKSFNMVGLPHETILSLWRTIWLNLKLAPNAVQTSVYYPFKGTVLGDECYSNNWVDIERKKALRLYANDSILNLPGLPRWVIQAAKWFNSATVLRSGNIGVIKSGLEMVFSSIMSRFKNKVYRCLW